MSAYASGVYAGIKGSIEVLEDEVRKIKSDPDYDFESDYFLGIKLGIRRLKEHLCNVAFDGGN